MSFQQSSSEPNGGLGGQITFVAMRRSARASEVTYDCAMMDNDGLEVHVRLTALSRHTQEKDSLSICYENVPATATFMKRFSHLAATLLIVLLLAIVPHARGQEAVAEGVRVEGSFSSGLQTRPDPAVKELMKRLELRAEAEREIELSKANQGTVTKLLELVKAPAWLPLGLGGSEDRHDDFLRQNYMRADLNPRVTDPLRLRR